MVHAIILQILYMLSHFSLSLLACSAVGVRGGVLDVRPAAVRLLDAAGVPLPPRLLARPHLPRFLHRRRPLRIL